MRRLATWTGVLLAAGLAWAASAGDWHAFETSTCTDCHTMHGTQQGQPMRYDLEYVPGPGLLRHASALMLCVTCHDGSNASAPDVIAPVNYVADPLGGFFANAGGVASPQAHDLGMAGSQTPPGGDRSMVLTCITCHAHHGNANYRNLVGNPSGSGAAPVQVTVKQTLLPNGSNPTQVYVAGNLLYRAGMSAWCGDCHGDFHGRSGTAEGTASPWLRHPQDAQISGSPDADYAWWQGTVAGRVRVQTPNDDVVPSTDDQVFCLSCHKAHGSSARAALVFGDGVTLRSTCQQCHNQ